MKALILEEKNRIQIRDFQIEETMGPDDVKIQIKNVGICGSDIHYYSHGAIGSFVVKEPMVLGHEASGIILETGANVNHLKPGDKVCMEPGIPNPASSPYKMGMYNLDPDVVFWATPPVHGCLRETVIHPGAFTFKLPENVSLEEGAMVEPLAIGLHSATKAGIKPGDVAVVTGCGTIGILTAVSALAGGCSKVIITDVMQEKLDLAERIENLIPVNIAKKDLLEVVNNMTRGQGADILFEASGNGRVIVDMPRYVRPGGKIVQIGMPVGNTEVDIVGLQAKEITLYTIFRYAHIYPKAIDLIGSGKIDVTPFISKKYRFEEGVEAFEFASQNNPEIVKVQIEL